MFARYTGHCTFSDHEFAVGTPIQKNRTGVGYRCVECFPKRTADPNALENAVIAREVAEDEFFAAEYRYSLIEHKYAGATARRIADGGDVQRALQAMVDARMVALLEADAVGIINLFDPLADGETLVDRAGQTLRFAGAEADAHLDAARWAEHKNEYAAREREQEAAAYLSNPV